MTFVIGLLTGRPGLDTGCGGSTHLVVGGEYIQVPQDLRSRGARGSAHGFNITSLHLGHNLRCDIYHRKHCERTTGRSQLKHLTRYLLQGSDFITTLFSFPRRPSAL